MSKRRRNNGEGSISKRKDGRWQGTVQIAGKRRYVYGATRTEVSTKLQDLRKQHDQGVNLDQRQLTLAQWAECWLTKRRDRWSNGTYQFMEQNMRLHIIPRLGATRLSKLSVLGVERWLADFDNKKTAVVALRTLRRCLNDAIRCEIISKNVAQLAEAPKVEWRRGEALTHEQSAKFLKQAQGCRYEAAYILALRLGLRLGALCALKWADIDLDAATLTVRKGKTVAARRTIPLLPELVEHLRCHLHRQQEERRIVPGRIEDDAVFATVEGRHISDSALRAAFKKHLADAGLPPFRFHDLRHTALTRLAEENVSIAALMMIAGHTRATMSLDNYTHLSPDAVRNEMLSKRMS